jgi:hypothetical protein
MSGGGTTASGRTFTFLTTPVVVGGRTLPPLWLMGLAIIGLFLLAILVPVRWTEFGDEHAYWLAARRLIDDQPLYDPTATAVTPYAYWYPPVFAQALVPFAAVLGPEAFSVTWTALLLACLWWLGGRSVVGGLALIAFLPVAIELWFRNVHLPLAVLVAGGLLGAPWLFAIGAMIKFAPALGILYLAVRGRWRDALLATVLIGLIVAMSVLISPQAWRDYLDILTSRGPSDEAGLLPIPYWVRLGAGVVLAIVAGRLRPRIGDPLLVVAVVIASPTLWVAALAMLAAIVPVVRGGRPLRWTPRPASDDPPRDNP